MASAPPSTTSTCPVIHDAASDARNSAALAMSSGSPSRLQGQAPRPRRPRPLPQGPGEVGAHQSRGQRVDPHRRPELGGQLTRQVRQGGLGHVVPTDPVLDRQPPDRRHVDDRAAVLGHRGPPRALRPHQSGLAGSPAPSSRHAARSISTKRPEVGLVAALLTRTSSEPNRSTVASTQRRGGVGVADVGGVPGHVAGAAPPWTPPLRPALRPCATTSMTWAPDSANRVAMARADPARPPGDERHLAVEPEIHGATPYGDPASGTGHRPRRLRAPRRRQDLRRAAHACRGRRLARVNRLASETSPYLRQHADNPVDWYPWGDEAFDRARAEDRPVFLSVGYSAVPLVPCHGARVLRGRARPPTSSTPASCRSRWTVRSDPTSTPSTWRRSRP